MKTEPNKAVEGALRQKLESNTTSDAEPAAPIKYESGLIPLLWIGIPFLLILLYGFLT
jgi:hypothetical protein